MNIDSKHNLNTSIDKSLVSSTAQNSLGMKLKNQDSENFLKKDTDKDKEEADKKNKWLANEKLKLQKKDSSQIVRDPLKLLNLI